MLFEQEFVVNQSVFLDVIYIHLLSVNNIWALQYTLIVVRFVIGTCMMVIFCVFS